MKLSTVGETIEVNGDEPWIESSDSHIITYINHEQIKNLPVISRQCMALAALATGTTLTNFPDPSKLNSEAISITGGTGRNVHLSVDGGDNNDDTIGGIGQSFSLDSIAQISFLTNRYKAEFSWLPDSRHFVFDGQDHLWMADLKKDTVQPVTVSSNKEVNPSVSPDGKTIAYTLEQDDFDLIEIPLDGSPSRSLLSTSQNEMMPAWSPIGNQFAYVTDRTGVAEIWIKSLQERWDRPLVTSKDFGNDPTYLFAYPSFSPDGQRIAYQRIGGKGEIATWISTVAGGPPVRLTRNPLSSRATWSPDGNWMAYISGTEGNFVLAKVKVGGGSPPVILKNDAFLFPPQWSPKGDLICYLSTQGLALVTQDGKANRLFEARLLYNLGWSKDGSTLYGIMEVPGPWRIAVLSYDVLTGKEKIIVDLGSSADLKNIEGFSLSPDGKTFATSIARAKGDIWLLDGFNKKQSFFDLIWRK